MILLVKETLHYCIKLCGVFLFKKVTNNYLICLSLLYYSQLHNSGRHYTDFKMNKLIVHFPHELRVVNSKCKAVRLLAELKIKIKFKKSTIKKLERKDDDGMRIQKRWICAKVCIALASLQGQA